PLKIANSERHVQRLESLVATIGWRTHTADEIQAIYREDLRQRLRARVELLRQIKVLENRSTGHHPPWMDQAPYGAIPLAIYEGDDPAWFDELSAEEREASAGALSLRLFALAT